MWKKVVAVICVPMALFMSVVCVQAAYVTAGMVPIGTPTYRAAYTVGLVVGILVTAVLLFCWWRWIVLALSRKRKDKL